MRYVGSKSRHASEIHQIVLRNRTPDQWYVEPFVGGCNSFADVPNPRLGSDIKKSLIEFWRAVANGWLPADNYTEEDYAALKTEPWLDPITATYLSFACSYAGKEWGGFARSPGRDHVVEGYKNALIQFPKLAGAEFQCVSYQGLSIPQNSIIYCDPPYRNTTSHVGYFNHWLFWEWVRLKHKQGHRIYVSEYTAPPDFRCVWSKEIASSLDADTGNKRQVERLFTLEKR